MTDKPRRFGPPATRFLQEVAEVRVRFQEVDSMDMVWHGHYLTYFEEGRCALGRRFGFDYSDFAVHGFMAPLVHSEVDHFAPARFGDVLQVRTRLHIDQSARIDFTYKIVRRDEPATLVLGRTVQVLTTTDGQLCMAQPRFVVDFLERWRPAIESEVSAT
ncbi:MAG: thioesterase family protein [Planctomycetota bacterium]